MQEYINMFAGMNIICKLLGHKELLVHASKEKDDKEPKAQICKRCGMLIGVIIFNTIDNGWKENK